jgi:hypothetical protein
VEDQKVEERSNQGPGIKASKATVRAYFTLSIREDLYFYRLGVTEGVREVAGYCRVQVRDDDGPWTRIATEATRWSQRIS